MTAAHGKAGTYRNQNYACRCDDCTAANTERARRERRSRRERLAADPTLAPHGDVQTYKNWGCRCEPCTAVHAEACRQYKARKRQS